MLGLGIRYLNGWAMAAADGTRKERAECCRSFNFLNVSLFQPRLEYRCVHPGREPG